MVATPSQPLDASQLRERMMEDDDLVHAVRGLNAAIEVFIRTVLQMDSIAVYGCTNYMDARLAFTMSQVMKRRLVIPSDDATKLGNAVALFLRHLYDAPSGEKAYFIPHSGVYTLTVESYQNMQNFATFLKKNAYPM